MNKSEIATYLLVAYTYLAGMAIGYAIGKGWFKR